MMNPRLATRYAKSLLDLAVERQQLEPVYADMQYLQQIIRSSRELVTFLRSPVITADKKNEVLKSVTSGKIGELTGAFINLLVNKGREATLPEIISAFITQYKSYKGIHTVVLTTAVPVSDSLKQKLVQQVKDTSNMKTIELESVVDPNIIGGFVLQAGDQLVDASVSSDLKEISRQFENNDFIYKVR